MKRPVVIDLEYVGICGAAFLLGSIALGFWAASLCSQ